MADDESNERQRRQRERFGEAVERKKQDSERRSRQQGAGGGPVEDLESKGGVQGDQESLYDAERPQDVVGPREKSSGKKKKTADNWNQ